MPHLIPVLLASAVVCAAQEGTQVYMRHCQQCHSPGAVAHAPSLEALKSMPWERIVKALETGAMKAQGAALTAEERRAVARYLGSAQPAPAPVMSGACTPGARPTVTTSAWNGWGVDDRNSRFQPGAAAGMDASAVSGLRLKWAFGFPYGTTAFGQPTVVDGRLYTGSNAGIVYALDARTGCVYWAFEAKAVVRAAVLIGPGPRAYVGDLESNFYALDAGTGQLIWQRKLDDQPFTRITGAAKLHGGRLYVPIASQEENAGANPQYACCTFRGNLMALDAATGRVIWKSYTTPEAQPTRVSKAGVQFYGPSGATTWSSPTIDPQRNLVYITTGNGYSDPDVKTADALVAMDLDTGAIRWSQQASRDMFNWDCGGRRGGGGNCPAQAGEDVDFGSSAILVDVDRGRQLLLAGQKSGMVHAFDPEQQGRIVWQTRIGKGGKLGGVLWGMAAHDGVVYAALSDLDRNPAHGGGLFALDAATGKVLWSTPAPAPACAGKPGCSAAQTAAVTAIPGIVFSGSMDGHLRAYETKAGTIVWDFDALREFDTVNGVHARGGSFSAGGATVVDGMVYVNSGYTNAGGMGGNALLAFSVPR